MGRETKIIVTGDGSHSLYLPHLNETYHSSHGALTESKHVFIEAGLNHWLKNEGGDTLKVLEVGFGTGLNAFLALDFATKAEVNVEFTSLEPFPLDEEIYSQLNYTENLGPRATEVFLQLHQAPWDQVIPISNHFRLHKVLGKLEEFETETQFDVVFFDAFAPSKQAELWEYDILAKTVGLMAAKAVLATYCAKGQFKRDLTALGLQVETLPGPPGKKEMVRATTNEGFIRT